MARIKVNKSSLDFLDEIFKPHEFGSGFLGGLGGIALGEDEDADVFTRAVRQGNAAANHLVGFAGVHSQVEGDGDGRVEFRCREGFHGFHGFRDAVVLVRGNKLGCFLISLAAFGRHVCIWQCVRTGLILLR